jgi:hypothetical protein
MIGGGRRRSTNVRKVLNGIPYITILANRGRQIEAALSSATASDKSGSNPVTILVLGCMLFIPQDQRRISRTLKFFPGVSTRKKNHGP